MSVGAMRGQRAFTLVEMLVVIVIAGAVLALAAPSFRGMILMKRLSGINAQLVTDMQLARTEAATRNAFVRVSFRSDDVLTCYSIYTYPANAVRCDCRLTPACTAGEGTVEVRTVRTPRASGVSIVVPVSMPRDIAFDPITGGLWMAPRDDESTSLAEFDVNASVNVSLALRTELRRSGRPSVCAPAGSKMAVPSCS